MTEQFENDLQAAFRAELNDPQYEAVTCEGGPMLVLAGAGSGKTRVITYRIAYLIRVLKIKPWRILAVTFTNKAAGEMRHRVEQLLGGSARQVWLGTFHSTCVRILRKEITRLGYPQEFVIYDRADQLAVLRRCLKALNFSEKEMKPNAALSQISKAKQRLLTPAEYSLDPGGDWQEAVGRVYELYQDTLYENGAVDFDDLLMLVVKLFRDNSDLAREYSERFDHILVDEYQDTNLAQYLIVRELAKASGNICVVGDDDQSIYSWRGAMIENILGFERDWKETQVIRLEQNYRSTAHILNAAGGLIQFNKNRKRKKLWTDGDDGERVKIVGVPEDAGEAHWVAQRVKELRTQKHYRYADFAVFYRTNAQSRSFEQAFNQQGIPHVVIGGTAFYERKEVKDLLAYLRLIVSPGDRVAFERIVNVPRRGVGGKSLQVIFEFSNRMGIPIVEAAYQAERCDGITAAACKGLCAFGSMISAWREDSVTEPVMKLLERVLKESGYQTMLEEDRDPQAEARLENIKELVSAVVEAADAMQEEAPEPLSTFEVFATFLNDIALVTDVDNLKGEDRVALITLHSAKGLEFPVVFLTGFEEGLIPHNNAINARDTKSAVEEERRLCYVGMTRAMHILYLIYAHTRMIFGRSQMSMTSSFLNEIPREHVEHLALESGYAPESRLGVQTYSHQSLFDSGSSRSVHLNFSAGDTVHHRTFGLGVVLEVRAQNGDAKVDVDFQNVGKKTLLQSFAKLKKV